MTISGIFLISPQSSAQSEESVIHVSEDFLGLARDASVQSLNRTSIKSMYTNKERMKETKG